MPTEKTIYIKVKSDGKVYKSDAGKLEISHCDEVLFEHEQSQEVGVVISENCLKEENAENIEDMATVTLIRKLSDKDMEKIEELKAEAKDTLTKCEEKIKAHNLEMNLLDAELSYDGRKLTFFFTAPGRVDFRSLVPDLASSFKKLIRLQQVGSRDKAKLYGGFGRCGRKFCCKNFLKNELDSVTIDMAYDQNLGQMGSNRVTGCCGKLMCCLKYELDFYRERKKKMPAVGDKIKTDEGEGVVIDQNIMKNKVKAKVGEKIVEVDC